MPKVHLRPGYLVYLEPRERVCLLQMSYYFCWTKSENWSKCGCSL